MAASSRLGALAVTAFGRICPRLLIRSAARGTPWLVDSEARAWRDSSRLRAAFSPGQPASRSAGPELFTTGAREQRRSAPAVAACSAVSPWRLPDVAEITFGARSESAGPLAAIRVGPAHMASMWCDNVRAGQPSCKGPTHGVEQSRV
jgi:hypothetical protein